MDAFDRIAKRTPESAKKCIAKSLDIAERVRTILHEQGKTQRDLAKLLEKSESEVSRWLTGMHNFELETIAKIESVLGEEIITVVNPEKANAFMIALKEDLERMTEQLRQQVKESKPTSVPKKRTFAKVVH
jgi:transcriptional regulator with XRE-family HTH domain